MTREHLTGSRIRERRAMQGVRQADLARQVGISASYLNLIEHNRRRIGGKLLLDLAAALRVEPQALTQGAEVALISALREAAEAVQLAPAEADRAEDFAGRYPGWADALARAHRRVLSLERMVATLSDRMAHDPQLAASLHEVLTTAAAIRATAEILAETDDLEAGQQARFHQNMQQDSLRLAESAKTLVQFLDADPQDTGSATTPQDEVAAFMAKHQFSFPDLEQAEASGDQIDTLVAQAGMASQSAEHLARDILRQIAADGQELPSDHLRAAVGRLGIDPWALAQDLAQPLPLVLRQLAALPELGLGLVVADRAGRLLLRKPVDGFAMPRFGAACALWPIWDVIVQPQTALRCAVQMEGRGGGAFMTYAAAETGRQTAFNTPPLVRGVMLLQPKAQSDADDLIVGPTCRICPRRDCPGRQEVSILSETL